MESSHRWLSRRRFLAAGAAIGAAALGCGAAAGQSGGGADRWRLVASQQPGPPIRIRRGERIAARLVNDLAEPLALHWHGLRLPAAIDGRAVAPVAPRASLDYDFAPPDAGTFWYHARRPGPSGPRLQGLLIVDDAAPADIDHDVPAMLGAAGDGGIAVNGLPILDIPVRTHDRVRLRLVNAAGSKLLAVRVAGHDARVMAIDGQPAEPFLAKDGRVFLGPGNRIDLFIDAALEPGARSPIMIDGGAGETALLQLAYQPGRGRPAPRPDPPPLPANPLPDRIAFRGALRVDLGLDDTGFAAPARPDAPAFTAARGRTVMLAIANRASAAWALHVHGHSFRLLDRLDDGWKPFWLDTVIAPPGETTRIAFVADNPGGWAIDAETIGGGATASSWFQVT